MESKTSSSMSSSYTQLMFQEVNWNLLHILSFIHKWPQPCYVVNNP